MSEIYCLWVCVDVKIVVTWAKMILCILSSLLALLWSLIYAFLRDAWGGVYKVMWSALVELFVSHSLFLLYLFWYIHIFLKEFYMYGFIASICCNSSNLRSIGAIFSLLLRASVSVHFIDLRIGFMALLWASSRSFICLSKCIDCPHIIIPYSNFDQIKDL